mmetsp:Transcript_16926/g.31144  ORF Transcript_16926/g.31144 Transcript_16926/m.31144 type:complete len:238 (+) Transcript_16926:60-773(+)
MRLFRQQERNKPPASKSEFSSRSPEPLGPCNQPTICSLINMSTKFAGLLSMACSMLMLTESFISVGSLNLIALHVYTICLEAIVIMAELEWPAFFRVIPFLEGWAMRGLFQIFVGVLVQTGSILDDAGEKQVVAARNDKSGEVAGGGITVNESGEGGGLHAGEDVWFFVASWYLIATGTCYFLLGSLCFQRLKGWSELRKQVKKKRRSSKGEIQLLAKQKEEIDRLLIDTESKLQLL